jgi:Flp pilus assembly protein CpaB
MILQRAEVVWVNKGQANKNQEGGAESSMTLLVKPDDVELLTAAERAGVIRVSLRSTHDTQVFPRPKPPGLLFEPVEPTPVVVLTNDAPRATPVFISSPSPMRQGTKVYKGDKIIDVETDR